MTVRFRSKFPGEPDIGWKKLLDNVVQPHTAYRKRFDVEDVIKSGKDGEPFTTRKVVRSGGLYTWKPDAPSGNRFWNYVPDSLTNLASDAIYGHSSIPGEPSTEALATELLAKTNPSRPVTDLPTFVAELRELPQLLRVEGGNLLKRLASENLRYRFAIRPLVSDLLKLCNFQEHVTRRAIELAYLQRSGLRRRRRLWSGTKQWVSNGHIVQSVGGVLRLDLQSTTASVIGGYVEWYPLDKAPMTSRELLDMARAAVISWSTASDRHRGDIVNQASYAAWNLIPWSWLVDWCSNVGEFIVSRRNTIPCTHSQVLLMKHTATEGMAPARSGADWNISETRWWTESKSRRRATSSIVANLPFLSPGQLSILGSIGVTRRMSGSSL